MNTFIVCVLGIVLMEPIAVIWALNTLFNSGIAYGITEYLSIVILSGVIRMTLLTKAIKL